MSIYKFIEKYQEIENLIKTSDCDMSHYGWKKGADDLMEAFTMDIDFLQVNQNKITKILKNEQSNRIT